MSYGLTAAGFVVKPIEEIKAEIEADFKNTFGNAIDLSASEPFGQLVGIMADRESEIWDLLQEVYASQYPDSAEGTALVDVCAITGTVPNPATRSLVTGTLTGTPGTVVVAGKQASVQTAGTKFRTKADATIAAVGAWVNTTGYTLGQRRSNSGNAYQVITPGTSAGSGGPTTTASDIVDGTVHWKYLGPGTGAVDAAMESVDYGAKAANAGTLTVIETAVAGWNGVNNVLDAVPGNEAETDSALRIRRELELRAKGNAAADAVRGDILEATVAGAEFVQACKVFVNDTDATDVDGVPPHSINPVVQYPGAPDSAKDDAIRAALFASKAAGIQTFGAVSGTVTDASGNTQTVNFARPTEKDVWVIVNVTKDPATWPSDGVTQVKNALVAFGAANYGMGDDVIVSHLFPAVLDKVSGIVDVSFLVGFANPPVAAANLTIAPRELAVLDTSRISVVVV